jgi:hypothetical protein
MKRPAYRLPFLPVSIAMALLSFGFSVGPKEVRWFWEAEPHLALMLAIVGTALIAVHFIQRARHTRTRRRGSAPA